jgi:hypothetical protein
MPAESYLSQADADDINQVRRDILATKLTLQEPALTVILQRYDPIIDQITHLPPMTDVYVRIDRKQGREIPTDSTETMRQTGYLQREVPFPVQVDDTLTLDNGWICTVSQVQPERAGMIRADLRIDTGSTP